MVFPQSWVAHIILSYFLLILDSLYKSMDICDITSIVARSLSYACFDLVEPSNAVLVGITKDSDRLRFLSVQANKSPNMHLL